MMFRKNGGVEDAVVSSGRNAHELSGYIDAIKMSFATSWGKLHKD